LTIALLQIGALGAELGESSAASSPAAEQSADVLIKSEPHGDEIVCTYRHGETTFARNTKKRACPATSTPPSDYASKGRDDRSARLSAASSNGSLAKLVDSKSNANGGLDCTFEYGGKTFSKPTKKAACPLTTSPPSAQGASTASTGTTGRAAIGKGSTLALKSSTQPQTQHVSGPTGPTYVCKGDPPGFHLGGMPAGVPIFLAFEPNANPAPTLGAICAPSPKNLNNHFWATQGTAIRGRLTADEVGDGFAVVIGPPPAPGSTGYACKFTAGPLQGLTIASTGAPLTGPAGSACNDSYGSSGTQETP
jgi:hypothetical protein